MHVLSVWLPRRSCLDSEGAARTSKPETEEQGPAPGVSTRSNKSPPPGPRRLMFATLLAVPQQTAQVGTHDSRETIETAELQVLIASCGVASAFEAYCGERGRLDPWRHYLTGLHRAGPTSVFPTFGNDATQFWWLRL